jgi:hypothetical protein
MPAFPSKKPCCSPCAAKAQRTGQAVGGGDTSGLNLNLPPDPRAQYDHNASPQGQAETKAKAQASVLTFAKGIEDWAKGGPKPSLPSEGDMGHITAAIVGTTLGPEAGAAVEMGFQQAAYERQAFDAIGVPTWARVLSAASYADVGNSINAIYDAISSLWGSQGCPSPTFPDCSQPHASGPSDPSWKTIGGDCDYPHAAWLMADIDSIESAPDILDPSIQFRYLFDQVLFAVWEASLNCICPPLNDRDVLYTLADVWNSRHRSDSTHEFEPIAIDPGHDWYDPPNPTYLEWCLSGGPSGFNMGTPIHDAGSLSINTGELIPDYVGGLIQAQHTAIASLTAQQNLDRVRAHAMAIGADPRNPEAYLQAYRACAALGDEQCQATLTQIASEEQAIKRDLGFWIAYYQAPQNQRPVLLDARAIKTISLDQMSAAQRYINAMNHPLVQRIAGEMKGHSR